MSFNVVEVSTVLANIVTIAGIIALGKSLYSYLKSKTHKKIEMDNDLNLLTSTRKIEKVAVALINKPQELENLEIIVKLPLIKRIKSIAVPSINNAFINKLFEFQISRKILTIKRGMQIIFSQVIICNIDFFSATDHAFDKFIGEFIKTVKNMAVHPDIYDKAIDVFAGDLKSIKTTLYLTREESSKLEFNMMNRNSVFSHLDFSDVIKTNKKFLNEALLGIILSIALNDSLWKENEFLHKEKLPFLLNYRSWDVGEM